MDRVTLDSPYKPNILHSRLLDCVSVWFVWFDYKPLGQELCLILCSLQHLAHCWHHQMPKNTQSLLTNNKIDFPTQCDEVSVIFMPVFFLICISYLCLESKLHVLLNHLWTDLLFRKCRHEAECFPTTSFGNTDCWNMLGYMKGKCFWKSHFFSFFFQQSWGSLWAKDADWLADVTIKPAGPFNAIFHFIFSVPKENSQLSGLLMSF